MTKTIDCFIAYSDRDTVEYIVGQLHAASCVGNIFLLVSDAADVAGIDGCRVLAVDGINSSSAVSSVAAAVESPYALVCLKPVSLTFMRKSIDRMAEVMRASGASMLYSDRYSIKEGQKSKSPTIDYQLGSVRNDFDFGSVVLYDGAAMKGYASDTDAGGKYDYAGWYALNLALSRKNDGAGILHLREYLYSEEEPDLRKSGEKQFDYVDPRNRAVQIEMERACTAHLNAIGALVPAEMLQNVSFGDAGFDVEASVIIPVRNRVRTIEDAVRSALSQKTDFY